MADALRQRLEAIASDNTSGATALAAQAACLLTDFARERGTACSMQELAEVGQALVRVQPSMAPIANLVNQVLLAAEGAINVGAAAADAALRFAKRLSEGTRACGEHVDRLLGERRRIVVATHSASSAVREALLLAARRRPRLQLLCSESRPMCEGVAFAEQLAAAGISVTLLTDAALMSYVDHCQAVLIGADEVRPDGVVNKIGTRALATCARTADVPVYVLATREKWLPSALAPVFTVTEHPPEQIVDPVPEGVVVDNRYFDTTPYSLVSQVITETGAVEPSCILEQLQTMEVSPWLLPRSSP